MDRSHVFISYSHRDKRRWLPRLKVHLKPLERDGLIDAWDDTQIKAGQRWREEIKTALAIARVAILLVSADFLASDFIAKDELPPLLAAEESRGLVILPVILSPCLFNRTLDLSKFQAVNPADRPLSSMKPAEQEGVWVKVAEAVESAVNSPGPMVSSAVAVRNSAVLMKHYLTEDRFRIQLAELVRKETEDLYEQLFSQPAPADVTVPDGIQRMLRIEQSVATALSMVIDGCHYGLPQHGRIWMNVFERIGSPPRPQGPFNPPWEHLNLYPALILLYGAGISSAAAEKYDSLSAIANRVRVPDTARVEMNLLNRLFENGMPSHELAREIPELERHYTPVNDHLFAVMREPFRELIPEDRQYERWFDQFEYLLALISFDLTQDNSLMPWAPPMRFLWNRRNVFEELARELDVVGDQWPGLQAGLFHGSLDHLRQVTADYREFMTKQRANMHIM